MSKKTPVKKSRRRLKRSIRKSLAAVLMITAIGVAAIPVPENAAATDAPAADVPMAVAEIDAYKEGTYGRKTDKNGELVKDGNGEVIIEYERQGISEGSMAVYSLDIYNGGLYWQYKIDKNTRMVVEYNNAYPNTTLTLSESAPTNYTYIKSSEFNTWVRNTNYTLTAAGYNQQQAAWEFFEKFFANDQGYKDFMARKDTDDPIREITRGVSNLSDTVQRTYFCDVYAQYGDLNLAGYMLVPITNQVKASDEGGAVLEQISKFFEGAASEDDDKSIHEGDLLYIPQYIGTDNTQQRLQDDEGYRLATSGEQVTSTQAIDGVGKYAFAGNGVLTSIELPDWLQKIGEGAFMDCVYLNSISIPFLKSVPEAAFKNCASLKTVNWWLEGKSSGLQTIGREAFFGTSVVENTSGQGLLKFPIGIGTIGDAAFYRCGAIQKIEFESPNPGTPMTINQYAFYDNIALTSVSFNKKVVNKLDNYCFAVGLYSNAMENFTFPDSDFTTGNKILANRTELKQITVPGGVMKLPENVLEGCTGLQVATFQGAGTSYDPGLFSSVETDDFYVTGPAMTTNASKDDVKKASQPRRSTWNAKKTAAGNNIPYLYKIGNKEYYEICSGEGYLESIDKSTGTLTSCDLRDDATVTNGELVIPDVVGTTPVVKIASDCFKGKDRLTSSVKSLVIGNNILTIEDSVFKSWNDLKEVEIGKSVQTIGKEAFASCTSLRDVTFATPDNYETMQPIGANAFAVKSGRLTIHGDLVDGYAPFEYATDPNNFVESSVAAGSAAKSRILYQSRWDSPSSKHMSVLYGEYNDGNGYVTLVDYPLYQDFFSVDENGKPSADLSADLEAHNRDMEKQFYNAYGNYSYPSTEDAYLEDKVRFADAYEKDPQAAYSGSYYGPWINPSFCADYTQWLALRGQYGLDSGASSDEGPDVSLDTAWNWLFAPITVKAAEEEPGKPKKPPMAYFDYEDEDGNKIHAYNFLQHYLDKNGDREQITNDYIDGWTIDEQDMIEAAVKIVIPAGVESIDIKEFYGCERTSQQNAASNRDNYITYFGRNSADNSIGGYSREGVFVYGIYEVDKDSDSIGLFSGNIDDRYTADELAGLDNKTIDQDDKDNKHRKGNDRIKVVDMSQSNVRKIPDYAFDDCELLEEVSIPASCETTGKLPFWNCVKLKNLSSGSEDVPALNGILYQKKVDENDISYELVECILAKGIGAGSGMIYADTDDPYISMVSSIGESAFENCQGIVSVNLSSIDNGASSNKLKAIPDYCFRNCDALKAVELPESANDCGLEAFAYIREDYYYQKNSDEPRLVITVRGSEFNFATTAFNPLGDGAPGENENTINMVTVWTYEDSAAERYVLEHQKQNYDIRLGDEGPEHKNHQYLGKTKRVNFWDYNYEPLCNTIHLPEGKDRIYEEDIPAKVIATVTDPTHYSGHSFTGWRGEGGQTPGTPITGDSVTYIAQYESDGTMVNGRYVVEFRDNINGDLISGLGANEKDGKYYIVPGTSFADAGIKPPTQPVYEGYSFLQWSHGWTENTVIDSSMLIIGLYAPEINSDGTGTGTGTVSSGSTQTGNGGTTSRSSSSTKSSTSSGSSTSTTSSTGAQELYTLLVVNGSGSGSYAAGTSVVITANAPATGQVFNRWTTETEGVNFTSTSMPATVIVMPASNATVTAEFGTGSGAAPAAASTAGSGGATRTPAAATGNGSTRVDITKPGISNRDLATARVNGSTDNFVVKISETQEATQAVANALTNKYGNLEDILYYAMDISLYDSTGTTKISDATGLTVDITIPIPDALVAYGGNNMAGAVVSNQLEDLGVRFSTINGVPCVNFTATHFSPYTVYVDTSNLTAGMLDVTPKTGDPIHPKWFLSLGLACLSVILFIKKDKRVVVKRA